MDSVIEFNHIGIFRKGKIKTQLRVLNADERIVEIAEMLGGKALTDSALAHAKELLN